MTTEVNFIYDSSPVWPPYIMEQTPIAYVSDGKEGFITFNGTYHVENHPPPYPEDEALPRWERPRRYTDYLPQKHFMHVKVRESTPYSVYMYQGMLHIHTIRL